MDIESRITSPFNGFSSGNEYHLANGLKLKQTDLALAISVKVQPRVTVSNDLGGLKMKVDGIDRAIRVTKII